MTVAATTRKAGPYTGNSITVAFPFSFKVFAGSEVVVTQTDLSSAESVKTLTTDYTVSLNADQDANPGGTVNMVVAPATGYLITLTSNVTPSQGVTLTNGGGFYPKVISDALDRATILIQQLSEQVGRALTIPVSSSLTVAQYIASIVASAGGIVLPVNVSQGGTNATTAAGARSNLGAVGVAGDQMTGALLFKSGLNNIASAATLNLTAIGANSAHVTGTTGISALTMTSGQVIDLVFDGALTLTHHATNNNLPGAAGITTAAGDRARYWYDGTTVWCVSYIKANGTPVVSSSSWSTVQSSFKNLAASATGTNASVSVSADEVAVEDGSNTYQILRNFSRTINSATSGAADGLDTGTIAASTWYSVWAIAKSDGTQGGLLSLSATAPTMPSGYTYKARIGWIRTDGTGNKYPLSFKQKGRSVEYKIAAGSNVTAFPTIGSSTSGTFNNSTYTPTAAAIGNFVPSTASKIKFVANGQNSAVQAGVTPNNDASWTGYAGANGPAFSFFGGSTATTLCGELMLESTNIYWANNTGASFLLQCLGWEDNI